MLGEHFTHGHLCGTALEQGRARRRRRLARGRNGSGSGARWLVRGAIASAVLAVGTGCAVLDQNLARAWKVEPLLNVQHALQSSEAYYTLGRYHDGSRNWEQSATAYRKAIAADAMHIEAYNALGVALARLERFDEAETTLRQAVAIAPSLAHLRSNLGYTLLLAGKVHDAVAELQSAVAQDRADNVAVANLRQALASWEAVRAVPDVPGAKAATVAAAPVQAAPALPVPGAQDVSAAPSASLQRSVPLLQRAAGTIEVPAPIVTAVMPEPLVAAEMPMPIAVAEVPSPFAAAVPPAAPRSMAVPAAAASNRAGQAVTLAQLPALAAIAQAALVLRVVDEPTVGSLQRSAAEPSSVGLALASNAGVAGGSAPVAVSPAANASSAASPDGGPRDARTLRPVTQLLPDVTVEAIVARLEVSNGNGVTGMAARVGHWLASQGVKPAVRLTNQRPFQQGETLIQYRKGHEEAARQVARLLPAEARTAALPSSALGSDVRVLLGRDWVDEAACLSDHSCKPMWAQRREVDVLRRAALDAKGQGQAR